MKLSSVLEKKIKVFDHRVNNIQTLCVIMIFSMDQIFIRVYSINIVMIMLHLSIYPTGYTCMLSNYQVLLLNLAEDSELASFQTVFHKLQSVFSSQNACTDVHVHMEIVTNAQVYYKRKKSGGLDPHLGHQSVVALRRAVA